MKIMKLGNQEASMKPTKMSKQVIRVAIAIIALLIECRPLSPGAGQVAVDAAPAAIVIDTESELFKQKIQQHQQQQLQAPIKSTTTTSRLYKRAATARADRLWDDAVIPYEIDQIFSDEKASLFKAAMRHWENSTCIKFVERQPEEHRNYIVFTERSCGCCSFVGKRGNGAQAISIGKHCDKFGIVVHELGHVVGFWHEHTRPDRDQHVQIIGKNIMSGQEYNFNKLTKDEVNSLGLAYDYDSILHYATNTFARDTYLDTILPLHGHLNTEEVMPNVMTNLTNSISNETSPLTMDNNNSAAQQLLLRDEARRQLESDYQSMLKFDGKTPTGEISRRPDGGTMNRIMQDADTSDYMISMDNLLAKTRPEIGQRVRLSAGDIAQTNLLYKCPKCGRTIQQPSGSFHSPNYYSMNINNNINNFCEWRLSANQGERIMINITDLDISTTTTTTTMTHQQQHIKPARFGLPRAAMDARELHDVVGSPMPGYSNEQRHQRPMIILDCQQSNYLEVRDGYTSRAPLLARLCGNIATLRDILKPIVSTSNRMLITYSSGGTGPYLGRGFFAHQETICGGRLILGSGFGSLPISLTPTTQPPPPTTPATLPTLTLTNAPNRQKYPVPSVPGENEVLLSSQIANQANILQQSPNQQQQQQAIKLDADNSSPINNNSHQQLQNTRQSAGQPMSGSFDMWPIVNTSVIQSPNWPESYRPSRECLWQIKAEENHQIALKFESFELEPHDSCAYDYVEVRDGFNAGAQLIGRFCGSRLPEQVYSSGPEMFVKFVSDSDVNKSGFLASLQPELDECKLGTHGCSYRCVSNSPLVPYRCECPTGLELAPDGKMCIPLCGGVHNESTGRISSPSFPDLYPISTKCLWEIQAPVQHRIALNFTHFDLEGIRGQECDYDYISIVSIQRRNPADQTTTVSNVNKQQQQQQQHSVATKQAATTSQQAAQQAIANGIYCGQQNQSFLVISVANVVRLEFNSDNSIQKTGFELTYSIDRDECASNNGGCQQLCTNTLGSYQCSCLNGFQLHENGHDCLGSHCLNSITAHEGTFKSPNYPAGYQANRDCTWMFSTAPGHRIKLNFDQFELESHQECAYDYVAIYDGEGIHDRALGRFCGSRRPLTIVSSFNMLYLGFHSDATNEKRGFNGTHSTICGGRLQARLDQTDHILSHAQFDGSVHYNRNEDCDWILETVASGGDNQQLRIRVEFVYFSLEADVNCNYDQATIFDGPNDSAPQIARLCGSDLPIEQLKFSSSGDTMLISFKSDDSINGKGFSLSYTAIEQQQQLPLAASTGGSGGGAGGGIEDDNGNNETSKSMQQQQQQQQQQIGAAT